MATIEELEKRIDRIEMRNARVESDKSWETSWVRRISLSVLTFIVMYVFLYTIKAPDIFMTAFLTVLSFILSTISLRIIRKGSGH
jgi:hypothetical protein